MKNNYYVDQVITEAVNWWVEGIKECQKRELNKALYGEVSKEQLEVFRESLTKEIEKNMRMNGNCTVSTEHYEDNGGYLIETFLGHDVIEKAIEDAQMHYLSVPYASTMRITKDTVKVSQPSDRARENKAIARWKERYIREHPRGGDAPIHYDPFRTIYAVDYKTIMNTKRVEEGGHITRISSEDRYKHLIKKR